VTDANLRVRRAGVADLDQVVSLVRSQGLPLDGLRDHLAMILVASDDSDIVGSAAVEMYADGALLRSVAVTPARQGHGVGRKLTEAAVQLAADHGASVVFVLTTTAERYFPKLGFERIDRGDVPQGVRGSVEFTSACPMSAVVLQRVIRP